MGVHIGSFRAAIFIVAVILSLQSGAEEEMAGRIIRLDPGFDSVVHQSASIEKIADGFRWVEGPLWNREEQFLLFSDIPANRIMQWKDGTTSVYLEQSGYTGREKFQGKEPGSNGLTYDAQGRLIICQHGDRRIIRLEKDGSRSVLAERYEGKQLNSPNDVVYKSDRTMYFTDPPFGLPGTFQDPEKKLDFQGVYSLSKDGALRLLTKEVRAPNGIAFSPDEKKLYVSDPLAVAWYVFDVKSDGSIENKKLLFDGQSLKKNGPGGPDGIKVDQNGNLFTAGPGGIYVISPHGKLLGWFDLKVPTGNCAWGDDGTLFVTANTAIYKIKMKEGK